MAFELGEGTVGLSTPTKEIAELVTRFLPDYAFPLEEADPDETYWMNEDAGSWSVEFAGASVVDTFASQCDALNALEQLLVTRLLAVTPRTAQLHATGTVKDGKAIIALGASGAGKTSIALNWCLAGRPVLGDDVILLDRDGVASPFRRLFIVHAERLRHTRVTPEPDLAWLGDAEEYWYDPRAGGGFAEPAPVETIALVQHTPCTTLVVRELRKPEALSAMLASLLPTGLNAAQFFDSTLELVSRVPTIEISFSDSAEAAEYLVSER